MGWLTKVGSFFGGIGTTVATTMSGTNFKLYFHIAVILLIVAGFIGMRIWVSVLKTEIENKDKRIEQLVKEVTTYKEQLALKDTVIKGLESTIKQREQQIANLVETIEKWKGNKVVADEEKDKIDAVVAEIEKLNSGNKVTCRFTPLRVRNVVVPPIVVKPVDPIVVPEKPIEKPLETPDTTQPDTFPVPNDNACSAVIPAAFYPAQDNTYTNCPETKPYVKLLNELFLGNTQ